MGGVGNGFIPSVTKRAIWVCVVMLTDFGGTMRSSSEGNLAREAPCSTRASWDNRVVAG